MRWIAAPLIACLLLGVSGSLDAIERYGEETVALAELSREAPETTQEASREVEDLPAIADLTSQQADAFEALADALELSAERVERLNERLGSQVEGVGDLRSRLGEIGPLISCAQDRLRSLIAASSGVPSKIRDLAGTLERVSDSSRKSVRHLKSINRKLAALGVAAAAQGVEVPPPPSDPNLTDPPAGSEGRPC